MLLGQLLTTTLTTYHALQANQARDALQGEWDNLSKAVEGRLYRAQPFAEPCYSHPFNSTECTTVREEYTDELARTDQPSAYIQPQWETCQATSEDCLLRDAQSMTSAAQCHVGSTSPRFILVQKPSDISHAFEFSRRTKVPLVIKNTGHDYKGRSSAPGSLSLWTHHLKEIRHDAAFTPEGCTTSHPAMTVGAGVQWGEAYAYAEANNLTVVGGADKAVGVAGGWLQGGGHGGLSNTMGLGVDRVLQYKVVTPDGKYRVVNECQNKDLFFALRGGGGGTFGVVLEASILTSPTVTLQTVILKFNSNTTLTKELWTIMADNSLKWSNDGWGGWSMANVAVLINPKLTADQAKESMKPLIDLGQRLQSEGVDGLSFVVTTFPSWGVFFSVFTKDFVASVGTSLAIASRLISKSNFETPQKRQETVQALISADAATPGLIMLMTAPASVPSTGGTSVTEAWRSSIYHVTIVAPWDVNATAEQKRQRYRDASASIDNLRKVTPTAAYLNEADVYEPNHEVAFWGEHYQELLRIKKK
ncbi:FAD binding domain-containing protein [Panaeolus papilionaceus]|nr:FAD binding domain-containing protein [Panaeolus papilionaceus]